MSNYGNIKRSSPCGPLAVSLCRALTQNWPILDLDSGFGGLRWPGQLVAGALVAARLWRWRSRAGLGNCAAWRSSS